MDPIPMLPEHAWFYHIWGTWATPSTMQAFPEFYTAEMPAGTQYCLTHRPTSQCQCGLHMLHWLTKDDAA